MVNYKIVKEDKVFNVVETATEQVIKVLDSKPEAIKLVQHLNMGGGFDGFTPTYMTYPQVLKEG
jgi:hypothetical protein